jgi:hypothetical protein
MAHRKLARLEASAGKQEVALRLYEKAYQILTDLANNAPGISEWAKDKEMVEEELARCRALS